MKRLFRAARGSALIAGFLGLLLAGTNAFAVITATWVVDSYESFEAGEAERALVTSLGEVRPGWGSSELELSFTGAWSAVEDKDGTVYIGSDDNGAIYAVRGQKVEKLAAIKKAVAITSLALGQGGQLFAGTMPGGEVWRIDSRSGKATKLAKLKGAETVWSLAYEPAGKTLYAGTGPEGKLFALQPGKGAPRVVFDTEDKRIMSLVASSEGSVWLGTSDSALVFRYDPKTRRARAMADFAGNEVGALAEYRGGVIAAASELEPPSTSGAKTKEAVDKVKKRKEPGQTLKSPPAGSVPGADAKAPEGSEAPRKGGRKGKGALFRVRGDGQLTQLHALTSTYFTSVAVSDDGRIFAGAADKGRVYLVDVDDSVSTAFDVEQRRVTQLLWSEARGLTFTTGDSAALYRSTGRAKNALYTSEVFDAKAPARFGRISWRGEGAAALETRSGNIAEPGVGWSRWQRPTKTVRAGGREHSGEVASPPGRYLQYRAVLGSGATLSRTVLYYLPHNRPTRVTEVSVTAEGAQKRPVTIQRDAAEVRSPVMKIEWKVDNEDKDSTVYRLEVRREGDVRWRPLQTGTKPLASTEFEWNTETFPDGFYRLRVTASDSRANTAARAEETSQTTPLFVIDNTRPTLSAVTVSYPQAAARASDKLSVVAEMAFSVDDGPWHIGGTSDGLFDDRSEMLRITMDSGLAPGAHTLAIRVADSAGNIVSEAVTFEVR